MRSEPERNPWARTQPMPCPGGVEESSCRRVVDYLWSGESLRPFRGDVAVLRNIFHGLRSAEDSLTPPVATTRRPVGANKPDKVPHLLNETDKRKWLQGRNALATK